MLPEKFVSRMKDMLGDEYPAFESALTNSDAVRGARLNLIKWRGEIPKIDGAELTRIPYTENGYILHGECQIGRSPYHHAGIIYMQDPGAMSSLSALDISGDEWVLDLCAAPGGKASQAAERLTDGGFLLANEYVPKRAKIMLGNFERLGISNAVITSQDTEKIAELFPSCFDVVIADAPCSGEGMFRKNEEAVAEWSEENVKLCAERQAHILNSAYRALAPGGRLLYSTCTWSIEENEGAVLDFLKSHPDMSLIPVKPPLAEATRDGIAIEGMESLKLTRRFYPHVTPGEGQFVALMQKSESGKRGVPAFREVAKAPTRDEIKATEAFLKDVLSDIPRGRLIKAGDGIVLVPHSSPIPPYSVFMSGIMLGELQGKTFKPHHHLFSALGRSFKGQVELGDDPIRLERYLRGEEIEVPASLSGYVSVLYKSAPLGGGKASGGRLKNHYPKGLRNLPL